MKLLTTDRPIVVARFVTLAEPLSALRLQNYKYLMEPTEIPFGPLIYDCVGRRKRSVVKVLF